MKALIEIINTDNTPDTITQIIDELIKNNPCFKRSRGYLRLCD